MEFAAVFLIPEGVWQFVTIFGICIVFLIPCFYALKLEVSVGVYKCKECGYEIVPSATNNKFLIHSRRMIVSSTRRKNEA